LKVRGSVPLARRKARRNGHQQRLRPKQRLLRIVGNDYSNDRVLSRKNASVPEALVRLH
jgi:hypothetical protein